ncbi:MAG: methylenetetrahydrofolate--tRNA-(uracil(54)-C(5))-methyltransferase (FADH(2)-oxidizing) TrmFO [Armatimonadetes bacterium]|nr:methylenetetrahydrofolate--tRNA-(uracil(54)-C(5))-methyltransferase (FADH(2)-oxidizing) TrmFO [Armatimonadota bacterium]
MRHNLDLVIRIVGAGFAGVEAAWACVSRSVEVALYEMRPVKSSPAHTTDYFAELVCSNSLKSKLPTSPAGQLKAEMAALGSIILQLAEENAVPGGEALCVDRNAFGQAVTQTISEHPLISVSREEVTPAMVDEWLAQGDQVVLASGPLTSPALSDWLAKKTGRSHLYFYDAVSPTVEASSLDMSIVFAESRYGKGEGNDYLNCPFNKENYEAFVAALVTAERAPFHAFEAGGVRGEVEIDEDYKLPGEHQLLEQIKYFAGCTPIEAIAEKGARSLAFGNFKPMGLTNPATGRRPWAALQLRPENKEKTLYSLVACQTRLKFGEQKRVFRMVPGLENAEFVRYGVIHRNTYIEAPKALQPNLEMRDVPNLFIAGQLTGVEGYVESAAMGILAGLCAVAKAQGREVPVAPRETAYGALLAHLQDDTPREFAPMNINWGILPDPDPVPRDKSVKRAMKIEAAQAGLQFWLEALAL